MQIDPFLSPCTKLKSKWIKELHIKLETLKLIEEKVGKSLEHMSTGEKIFTNPISDRGLISNIYKELKKLDSRGKNCPIKIWCTELHKEFSTEEHQMPEKHLKKCSKYLVVRKMQIKTTLRFYLTP